MIHHSCITARRTAKVQPLRTPSFHRGSPTTLHPSVPARSTVPREPVSNTTITTSPAANTFPFFARFLLQLLISRTDRCNFHVHAVCATADNLIRTPIVCVLMLIRVVSPSLLYNDGRVAYTWRTPDVWAYRIPSVVLLSRLGERNATFLCTASIITATFAAWFYFQNLVASLAPGTCSAASASLPPSFPPPLPFPLPTVFEGEDNLFVRMW